MTNHHAKLEDPRAISYLVIDRTRFVYGQMDQPTDRITDGPTFAKQYIPTSSKGGIIKVLITQLSIFNHFTSNSLLDSSIWRAMDL